MSDQTDFGLTVMALIFFPLGADLPYLPDLGAFSSHNSVSRPQNRDTKYLASHLVLEQLSMEATRVSWLASHRSLRIHASLPIPGWCPGSPKRSTDGEYPLLKTQSQCPRNHGAWHRGFESRGQARSGASSLLHCHFHPH